MNRRRYPYTVLIVFALALLFCWTAIKIDERCARNEAEREAVSVKKLVAESMNSHRLPKED